MNENKMPEKYLPIGSVVLLKGGKKRIMITGYASVDIQKKDMIYDYSACLFPMGILNTNQTILFNHDNIEKVFAIGYQDEEQKEFVKNLKENLTEEKAKKVLDDLKNKNENVEKE